MLCGTCAFGMAAPGAFGASARVSPRQSCATSIPTIGRRGRGATVWRAAATRGDDALTGRDRESRDIPRWDSVRRAGARGNGSTPGATGTSVAERVSADSETCRAEAPNDSEEIVVEAPSATPPRATRPRRSRSKSRRTKIRRPPRSLRARTAVVCSWRRWRERPWRRRRGRLRSGR